MNYDVKEMVQKLNSLGAEAREAAAKAIYSTALKTRALAVAKAPAGHGRGGSGEMSIRSWITAEYKGEIAGMQRAEVVSNSQHSAYVEFGTGPMGAQNHGGISPYVSPSYTTAFYVRNPKSRHFGEELRTPSGMPYWIYNSGGQFYATSGQPARPYMYPASKEAEPILADEMEKAMQKIMK